MKSKLISTILTAAMTMTAVTLPMPLETDAGAESLIVRKFDLGGLGTDFSLSTIEIEQTSTGTITKPTI